MKKIIVILLFALPFMTVKATAQTGMIKTGTIETINSDGTGTLRDSQTGELRYYITRDGEFHREKAYGTRDGEFHFLVLSIGTEVSYLASEAQGIDQQKLDSILGLIR